MCKRDEDIKINSRFKYVTLLLVIHVCKVTSEVIDSKIRDPLWNYCNIINAITEETQLILGR